MHKLGSVAWTPAAIKLVIARPTKQPIGTIKLAIAVARDLSSSENQRFAIKLIAFRQSGSEMKKIVVPIYNTQN